MRLHLARHGETRHNEEGRIQGDLLDDGLNEAGARQADALARWYARPDAPRLAAVYSSPMARARETAERVAKAVGLQARPVLAGMREISWGALNGLRNVGLTRSTLQAVLAAWDAGQLHRAAPGGETPFDAWRRASKEMAALLARHEGEDVLVVGHGRVNKIVLSGLVHGALDRMEAFLQPNGGVTVVERAEGAWRVARAVSTEHLGATPAREDRAS